MLAQNQQRVQNQIPQQHQQRAPFPPTNQSHNFNNSLIIGTSTPASAPLPPRFFQLDSSTLQTGLEERIRDVLHSSIAPLVNVAWMEEFRALVEVGVSSACFGVGLLSSSSRFTSTMPSPSSSSNRPNSNTLGYTVAYGDQVYNLRYVIGASSITSLLSLLFSSISSVNSSINSRSQLLIRLIARFVLLSVLPVFSRLLQRRYLQREDEVPTLHHVRQAEKVLRALDLLNHITFLYSGQYRHAVDRLLGIRLASGDHDLALSAHTYLIDRQHYWQTVFAAMSLFMPMLNLSGWAKWFGQIARRGMYFLGFTGGAAAGRTLTNGEHEGNNNGDDSGSSTSSNRSQQHRRTMSNVETFECLICRTAPMAMPRRVRDCGHVCVCYYCSQTVKPEECPECHGSISGFTE